MSTPEHFSAALELLMEWVWVQYEGTDECRLCSGVKWRGHRESCELPAILRGLGIEPVIRPHPHPVRSGIDIELPI